MRCFIVFTPFTVADNMDCRSDLSNESHCSSFNFRLSLWNSFSHSRVFPRIFYLEPEKNRSVRNARSCYMDVGDEAADARSKTRAVA